jgi:hypothetical protein
MTEWLSNFCASLVSIPFQTKSVEKKIKKLRKIFNFKLEKNDVMSSLFE